MNQLNIRRKHSQGFVLITGLIFLLVITLLALSTMGSTTLEEKMASNLREKARAQEAADAALRDGEDRLARLTSYPVSSADYSYDPTPAQSNGDEVTWHLWPKGGPIGDAATSPAVFLDDATWAVNAKDPTDPVPTAFSLPFDTALIAPPQFFVEELGFKPTGGLAPDANARAQGMALYRVTSRAEGGNLAAKAVMQSIYRKRY